MSFAKAVISGTVVSDPEKRFTPNNHAVTNFTLQVENGGSSNRPGANEPFPVKITCWRNLADAAAEQLHKGEYVLVEGKLIMNSYQSQEGVQKKAFELEAFSVERLPGKPEAIMPAGGGYGNESSASSGSRAQAPAQTGAPSRGEAVPSGHFSSEDLLTEDDIPF